MWVENADDCRKRGGRWTPAHFDRYGNFVHSTCDLGDGFKVIKGDSFDQNYITGKLLLEQRKTNQIMMQNAQREASLQRQKELESLNCPEGYIPIPGYYKKGIYVRSHCRKANEMSKDEKKVIKMMRRRKK